MLVLGAVLTLFPNHLLSVFRMPPTPGIWIRVVGVLGFNIGIYYLCAAKCEAKTFFQASVYTRVLVLVSFAAFAALGLAGPVLILLGTANVSHAAPRTSASGRLRA